MTNNETISSKGNTNKSYIETETYVRIAPDGGWGWCVVAGAFFSYYIADGLQYTFGIFLKDISTTFKCTENNVSMAGAINSCVFCMTGPFSAALVNKFGYRTISIVGSLVATLACILTSFANSIYLIVFFYGVIGGFGFGMIYITAMIAVGFYFERWRALATGLAVSGAGIGGMTLPQLFSALLHRIGWRNTFRSISCMTLLVILCGLLFRPIKPTRIIIRNEVRKSNQNIKNKNSKYHNSTYSKIMEKHSTITIIEPNKFPKVSSSEVMTTIYNTNSNERSYKIENYSTGESDNYYRREKQTCCSCCYDSCYRQRRTWQPIIHPARPMYREDILYGGLVINLPEYKKSVDSKRSKNMLEYQLSVTRESTHEDLAEKRTCCPIAMKRTIVTMLDYRLFKSPKFILLILNGFFSSLGFYTPYMFMKDNASQHGIDSNMTFWLISAMGITNTIGRICCGLLASIKNVKAVVIAFTMLFLGGLSTILSTLSYKLWAQFLYCSIYGFAMSSMSALRTIMIVEIFGLEKLTNAIGMILMFQGAAALTGIISSGLLKDATGDYKWSFCFAGASIVLGSVFLIVLHIRNTIELKRDELL